MIGFFFSLIHFMFRSWGMGTWPCSGFSFFFSLRVSYLIMLQKNGNLNFIYKIKIHFSEKQCCFRPKIVYFEQLLSFDNKKGKKIVKVFITTYFKKISISVVLTCSLFHYILRKKTALENILGLHFESTT